jgi:ER lumen protein retaining receptor
MMMATCGAFSAAGKQAPKALPAPQILAAYFVVFASILGVYHMIAEGEFSAILTFAAMFQCLAFGLLYIQVTLTGSCNGISARALALDALAICLRLSSTTWLDGYLPVDASGDWVYQAVDVVSLCIVLMVLYKLLKSMKSSYQQEQDDMAIVPTVLACVVLAALLHADMNAHPLFDTTWMSGLFISAVAVMPQLWLISKTGGKVQPLTAHYIAVMAISRALSGTFMWHARNDITCVEWVQGYNHAPWVILGAHAIHLLLLGDFGYYYTKSILSGGLNSALQLGDEFMV